MDKCPHIIRKSAGDEAYDFCERTERPSGRIKPCLLESGNGCEIWDEIQEEWRIEMDKEAQEMIVRIINAPLKAPWVGNATDTIQAGVQYQAKEILKLMKELGYRKINDEPPLLSDKEIKANYVQDSEFATGRRCTQAQREADIKFYEEI